MAWTLLLSLSSGSSSSSGDCVLVLALYSVVCATMAILLQLL
jgi:hypothetical protein